MITLKVGTVVGKGRASSKKPETRNYWQIAHSMALQPIKEALEYWESDNRLLQKKPTILTNKPKGSNTFHVNLKISNREWLFQEDDPTTPQIFSLKTNPDNKAQDEVAPGLKDLIEQVSAIQPGDKMGQAILKTFRESKQSRWEAYAKAIKVNDEDSTEKSKWWDLGAPNTNWANAKPEDRKNTDLITTNPVWSSEG